MRHDEACEPHQRRIVRTLVERGKFAQEYVIGGFRAQDEVQHQWPAPAPLWFGRGAGRMRVGGFAEA